MKEEAGKRPRQEDPPPRKGNAGQNITPLIFYTRKGVGCKATEGQLNVTKVFILVHITYIYFGCFC